MIEAQGRQTILPPEKALDREGAQLARGAFHPIAEGAIVLTSAGVLAVVGLLLEGVGVAGAVATGGIAGAAVVGLWVIYRGVRHLIRTNHYFNDRINTSEESLREMGREVTGTPMRPVN